VVAPPFILVVVVGQLHHTILLALAVVVVVVVVMIEITLMVVQEAHQILTKAVVVQLQMEALLAHQAGPEEKA